MHTVSLILLLMSSTRLVETPAHEGAAAEHAAGIVTLVVADSPVPGGKAA